MPSSSKQSPITSQSVKLDQSEMSSTQYHVDSAKNSSQVDLSTDDSLKSKLNSLMRWLINPFEKCCSPTTELHQTSNNSFDSRCLKAKFNHVNGLLKYFTFGVMFTNGILGFLIFIIGLWSSFEHRKINHIPSVKTEDSTSLNPFNFLGIILCIFGLLFSLLCIISCLGINRENLNLLRISLFGQFLTLILFITSAILILVWGGRIRSKVSEVLITGLRAHYHADQAWTTFFDKIQMSYYCCGVYSFNDWNDNPHYACTSDNMLRNFDACSVPFTCCKHEKNEDDANNSLNSRAYTCGMNTLPSDNMTINMSELQERINVNGCFDEILPIIQQLIITAAVFLLLTCVLIFVTIFLTASLIVQIRWTVSFVERCSRKIKGKNTTTFSVGDGDNF